MMVKERRNLIGDTSFLAVQQHPRDEARGISEVKAPTQNPEKICRQGWAAPPRCAILGWRGLQSGPLSRPGSCRVAQLTKV